MSPPLALCCTLKYVYLVTTVIFHVCREWLVLTPINELKNKNQAYWDTYRQASKKVAADLISVVAQVASQDELSCCTAEIQAQIFRNLQMHLETERLTQIDSN